MGSDNIFKKKKSRKKREREFLKPRVNSFLIVTEGEKTEPFYLNGIKKLITEKQEGSIDIYEIPNIEIKGQGRGTGKLIEETEKIVKNANKMYQNIWIVFDKDNFDDFDKAIADAKSKGYGVAWSNQSFEYWLYLHFHYSDSALHRSDWEEKLKELFARNNLGNGTYNKNDEEIFEIMNSFEGPKAAIKNAKQRMAKFKQGKKPSEYDPGTTVHILVEELLGYLK